MDLGAAVSSETPDYITNPSPCSFTYGCSTMGISKGCSDTYGSEFPASGLMLQV